MGLGETVGGAEGGMGGGRDWEGLEEGCRECGQNLVGMMIAVREGYAKSQCGF